MNWVDACKGKVEASCPFEYAARLTEVMLLGIVALRAGRKIYYDGPNMRVTNALQANDFLRREYRQAGPFKPSSSLRQLPARHFDQWEKSLFPAHSHVCHAERSEASAFLRTLPQRSMYSCCPMWIDCRRVWAR